MASLVEKKPFSLGQLVATPGALKAMEASGQTPLEFLARHCRGDWGTVCTEDWALNDEAVERGDRILSAYETSRGTRIWIITVRDRSSTCILLPAEY